MSSAAGPAGGGPQPCGENRRQHPSVGYDWAGSTCRSASASGVSFSPSSLSSLEQSIEMSSGVVQERGAEAAEPGRTSAGSWPRACRARGCRRRRRWARAARRGAGAPRAARLVGLCAYSATHGHACRAGGCSYVQRSLRLGVCALRRLSAAGAARRMALRSLSAAVCSCRQLSAAVTARLCNRQRHVHAVQALRAAHVEDPRGLQRQRQHTVLVGTLTFACTPLHAPPPAALPAPGHPRAARQRRLVMRPLRLDARRRLQSGGRPARRRRRRCALTPAGSAASPRSTSRRIAATRSATYVGVRHSSVKKVVGFCRQAASGRRRRAGRDAGP